MNEEYAITLGELRDLTLGELRDLIEVVIIAYGENTPYVLVGCYEAEGSVEKEFLLGQEDRVVRLFTDLCSG